MSVEQDSGNNLFSKFKKRFSSNNTGDNGASSQSGNLANNVIISKPIEEEIKTIEPSELKNQLTLNNQEDCYNYFLKTNLRFEYPSIEPFKSDFLKVDDKHEIYWEASGNPNGSPVVFLHGGPGAGTSENDRRWFDPNHYCIYLFDQRGSGKSIPHASLENNTTWDLVEDIEKLRKFFKVNKWHLFGGSWGSCLSLAYAQTYPERVLSLVLRGIFTLRRSELLFFYQDGTSHLFPDFFESYINQIPKDERSDVMKAYYKRLTNFDESIQHKAALEWMKWEISTSKLYIDFDHVKKAENDLKFALAFARIECHYFVNAGWFEEGQLLKKENIDKIRLIPTEIIQGRYDLVCPSKTAYDLHKQWPEANFQIIPDAGHASREPGIKNALINATDKMRKVLY